MLRLLRYKTPLPSNLKPPPISTSPTTNPSSSLTLHFLTTSCGLSPSAALFVSQKLHIKSTNNPIAVLSLLKSYHFAPSHISKLVSRLPQLLLSDPDNTLKPKLAFLESIGFTGPTLTSLIAYAPVLLQCSLANRLARNVALLKGLLHTDDDVKSTIMCSPLLLVSDLNKVLPPEMKMLEDYGVPTKVRLMVLTRHGKCLVDRRKRFEENFETVKRMGISPTSSTFAHALGVLAKLTERGWEKKMENFKRVGWSEEQVMLAFAKHPYCMTASSEKVVNNVGFFRDKFGWDAECVSRNPVVLSFSFEKRVLPRWRVLSVLEGKGLLKGGVRPRHLMVGEKVFLERYVMWHCEDIPEIMADEGIKDKMVELGLLGAGADELSS